MLWSNVLLATVLVFVLAACSPDKVATPAKPNDPATLTSDDMIGVWRRCNAQSKDCERVDDGWWVQPDGTWISVSEIFADRPHNEPVCRTERVGRIWWRDPSGDFVFRGYRTPRDRARWTFHERPMMAWVTTPKHRFAVRKVDPSLVRGPCVADRAPCTDNWQCASGRCSENKCFLAALIEHNSYY